MIHYEISIFINYISEHQLTHVIAASHTTPTSRINWGPMLLKLISRDIVHVLGGFSTYPEPRPNHLTLN